MELRWEGDPKRCVYYVFYHTHLLTHTSEDLSASDGWRYYIAHHRINISNYDAVLVSSPNADWCPQLRSPDAPTYLRADGTFGESDPTCWPQKYHPDAPHLPFIPLTNPNRRSLVHTFRCGLRKDLVTFTDGLEDGLRVGTLSEDFTRDLKQQVNDFLKDVREFSSAHEKSHPRIDELSRSLRIAITKISTLEDTLPRLRLMLGLASRFYFEAQGYLAYHAALKTAGEATTNPDLIGVWVEDVHICAEYRRMGVPVWFLRKHSQISATVDKFLKFSEPRSYGLRPLWPPDCFRDDGYVRDHPALLEGQTDTGTLIKTIDSWARSKLEAGFR